MKLTKVTLICLIVLSNTLERTLKDQKHISIAEKPSLRQLEDPDPAPASTPCEGKNYIIVKYSEKLKLPVPAEKPPEGDGRVLEDGAATGDERIVCISSESSQITETTEATEFQFYLKDEETSLENIFSKYEPTKITSLDFSNCKLDVVTNLNSLFKGCSSLTSINFGASKTEKATNMAGMFQNCTKLESVELSQI